MNDGEYRRSFRRPDDDPGSELDDEIDFHLEAIVDELVAKGWERDRARAEARRRFGDPRSVRRACRRERRGEWTRRAAGRALDATRQDVGYAVRQALRRPLLSGLVLATLVLGVGATTVIFSVVHATVLAPLPFDEPERLVHVQQASPQGRSYSISEPNFVDFRERQTSLADLAGVGWVTAVLTSDGEARALEAMRVSHSFFSLLGIDLVAGRGFTAEEDVHDGATDVAILSEDEWRSGFGGDPSVIGRTLVLDGISRQVVGVASATSVWPEVDVYLPLAPEPFEERDNQIIEAVGRLAPGVTLEEARADVSDIASALSEEYPDSNDRWGARVTPLHDWLVGGRVSRMGYFLLGAVGLLLLMACVSVTNLRVAEASARIREMGVRVALGAGRRRILFQLLVESLVLASVGGVLAVALSHQALPVVRALGPEEVARLGAAGISGPVLGVALGAAALAVLVSGVAPALVVGRSGALGALRAGRGRLSGQGGRLREALVAAQFALAVTVVVAAGLMTRSFRTLQDEEIGFDPGGVVRFSVRLPEARYDRDELHGYVSRLEERLEALPGVVAAGATHAPPFGWMRPSNFVARSDREPDRQQDFQPVSWRSVTDGYFEAAGIRLLAGRTFGPRDLPPEGEIDWDAARPPVVIDRTLAERLWPELESPVGELLTWFLPGGSRHRIVGVVAPVRDERVEAEPRPRVYRPYAWVPWLEPWVLVRTAGDPQALVPGIRDATLEVDPAIPAVAPAPVRRDLRDQLAWPRLGMQTLLAFGVVGLLLAGFGIYGVTAFTVVRRRREIGVRIALGAEPEGVLGLVLRHAMALAGLGIVAGMALSLAVATFLERLLYEVTATDPLTFLVVPALFALTALVAAGVPAWRAVGVDPREALFPE